jgi:hypothetical protein
MSGTRPRSFTAFLRLDVKVVPFRTLSSTLFDEISSEVEQPDLPCHFECFDQGEFNFLVTRIPSRRKSEFFDMIRQNAKQ